MPFPVGGPSDVIARVVAERAAVALAQPIIIENRPGAAGIIGMEAAARSEPNGYTVLLVAQTTAVLNPLLYTKIPFDIEKDFAAVVRFNSYSSVLAVNSNVPAKSLQEWVDLVKSRPNTMFYPTYGNGSTPHLTMLLLEKQLGLKMTAVAYKGSAQAITDLIAGEVHAMITPADTLLPGIKNGRLRPLAVAGSKRSQALPDVPTFVEAGLPPFDASSWFGLMVPAGVPAARVARLNEAFNQALTTPEVTTAFARAGLEVVGGTAAEFDAFMRQERGRWGAIIREAGIKLD
ncbi:MAG: Bug family tripartite tricarboxylate transporter substrate binding protein [Burkholderiaceae bacterium]